MTSKGRLWIRGSQPLRRLLIPLLIATIIAGCASPQIQQASAKNGRAHLGTEVAVMPDGYRLPLRRWGDTVRPRALVLALHGFNDYGNAFADLGAFLANRNILTYAYDQRGFGVSAQRGRWAGEQRMIADAKTLSQLLRERYPGVPLFLIGESMGGAVVIAAAAADIQAEGIVLIAPAVWSRENMNPVQRLLLKVAAHTVPWLKLTGKGLHIRPSDNLDMLRAFSADPLVIKKTRIDALWGVTNIMDLAIVRATQLPAPTLLLYGENDEIIPKKAFCTLLARIPEDRKGIRVVLYGNGWHMLTRDLQGKRVQADIAAWLADQDARLPSREEVHAGSQRLDRFCDK